MNIKTTLTAAATGIALVAATVSPAFALEAGVDVRVKADAPLKVRAEARATSTVKAAALEERQADRIQKTRTQAFKEIDRRIDGLNRLDARVNGMKRVATTSKATMSVTVDAQIKALADLRTKIQAATSTEALKTDVQSITKSHRVYALVIPQGHIVAAADKIVTTADAMAALNAKLQTRITEAKAAGKNVASAEASIVIITAKIAEAKTNAQAAITLAGSLKVDNGDQAVFTANKKALADARVKIKAGEAALKAARKEAHNITQSFKQMKIDVKVKGGATTTTTSTATTSVTQ